MTDPAPYGAGSVSSDGTLIIKEIAIKRGRLLASRRGRHYAAASSMFSMKMP